ARVKKPADVVYVRDQILAAAGAARAVTVPAQRLADAKSFNRYAFARTLDSTERIATVVSRYAVHRRSYDTVNNYYRTLDTIEPADIQAAARKYFTDAGTIVTTLSSNPLPPEIDRLPSLERIVAARGDASSDTPRAAPPPLSAL